MSLIKVNAIQTAGGLNGLTLNANGQVNVANTIGFADGTVMGSSSGSTMKNRIINGAMVIDQRGTATTPVTFNNNFPYSVDRWQTAQNAGPTQTLTAQQSSVVPNGNFTKSLLITTTTGASVSGSMYANFWQKIEGSNIADLGWGTANAQPVTVSFWARSSLTGNFGFFVQNNGTRTYMTAINIAAANTWQYFTITIPGDTSGTWSTTNTLGTYVGFDCGTGPGGTVSASTSWQSTGAQGLTNGVQLSATTGATFYVTGVQFEKGSTATSFDFRHYGQELSLCQRYLPAFLGTFAFPAWCSGTTGGYVEVPFQVPARAAASGTTITGATSSVVYSSAAGGISVTNLIFNSGDTYHARLNFSVASGLVAGNATALQGNGSVNILFTGCEL
jgi:hypothetical protein